MFSENGVFVVYMIVTCAIRLLPILVFVLAASVAYGGQRFVIAVEDSDWAGHYTWVDDHLTGVDVDVVRIVCRKLGLDVEFIPMPWRRANDAAMNAEVDAVLDVALTPRRENKMYCVKTPLSRNQVVFWVRAGSAISAKPPIPGYLRIGIIFSEDWSRHLPFEGGPIIVRFKTLEAGLRSLEAERIDAFGNYLMTVALKLEELGLSDKIVPSRPFYPSYYHLALSRKPGYGVLAKRLDEALRKFFDSRDYTATLRSNGIQEVGEAYHPSELEQSR